MYLQNLSRQLFPVHTCTFIEFYEKILIANIVINCEEKQKNIKKDVLFTDIFYFSKFGAEGGTWTLTNVFVHTPLKRACLPISPPPHNFNGAEGRIWTTDTGIFSPLLYPWATPAFAFKQKSFVII